ncbi:MAG: YciI family protein [Bacteroidota bacterium]
MKNSLFISLCLLLWMACETNQPTNQSTAPPPETETASKLPKVDTSLFETFEITEGDTTFLMKKYFFCFLKSGPSRDQDQEAAAQLQEAHLAHLGQLAEDQKICMAGPFEQSEDIRGIVIYSVPTLEEARALAEADPAVKAGRLVVELFPWWAAVGSQLF